MTARDLTGLLERIGARDGRLVHMERTPARSGRHGSWPQWADTDLVAAYQQLGIARPWAHQEQAASSVHSGRHTVIATGTGSGKSMAAWLPALSDVLTAQREDASAGRISAYGRRPTTLYLCPTKALAADQAAALERLVTAVETVQRGQAPGRGAGRARIAAAGSVTDRAREPDSGATGPGLSLIHISEPTRH